jgi:hypothetical protein
VSGVILVLVVERKVKASDFLFISQSMNSKQIITMRNKGCRRQTEGKIGENTESSKIDQLRQDLLGGYRDIYINT